MGLALRFISGKYQGKEFPLVEGKEVIVGRSSELDMVLVEEMVSRKHARMRLVGGRLEIEDLRSTNGTFVNGEKVTKTSVRRGDRILIGSNILRVVSTSSDDASQVRSASSSSSRRAVRRPHGDNSAESRMSGELQEIPLPDLLQLFGTSKKDGVLLIDTEVSIGRIILKKGLIHHAEISSPDGKIVPLAAEKAVYRILTWDSGFFELDPPTSDTFDNPLDMTAQAVLMEGFRRKDELAQLQARLPPVSGSLRLCVPLTAKLSELSTAELDMLQLAINSGSLGGALDMSPMPDLETTMAMVKLIEGNYLDIVES